MCHLIFRRLLDEYIFKECIQSAYLKSGERYKALSTILRLVLYYEPKIHLFQGSLSFSTMITYKTARRKRKERLCDLR